MRQALFDFTNGVFAHLAAVRLVRERPHVLRWVIPPVVITVVLFVLGCLWLSHLASAHLPLVLLSSRLLAGVVRALAHLAAVFLAGAVSVLLYSVVCVPFEELVAEDVSLEVLGRPLPPPSRSLVDGIVATAKQVAGLSGASLILLVVGLVPLVGPLLAFLGSAMVFGYGFMMVPADLFRLPMGDRLRHAWELRWRLLGFGVPIAAAALFPFLNLVFFPLYLVGGTILHWGNAARVLGEDPWLR